MSKEEPRLVGDPSGVRYRCYDISWDDAPDNLDARMDIYVPKDVVAEGMSENEEISDYLGDQLSNITGYCHTGFNFEKWHEHLDTPGRSDFENWYRILPRLACTPLDDGDLFRAFLAGRSSVPPSEPSANGDSFEPGRSFESPSEAIDYANAQRRPLEAAKEIIASNIDYSEYGFASEVCAMLEEIRADAPAAP
jgi:hypothetical protein